MTGILIGLARIGDRGRRGGGGAAARARARGRDGPGDDEADDGAPAHRTAAHDPGGPARPPHTAGWSATIPDWPPKQCVGQVICSRVQIVFIRRHQAVH